MKGLIDIFDNDTKKDITLQMEKIDGLETFNCFHGISDRATVPSLQDLMAKSKTYNMGTKSFQMQKGTSLVDPSGALSSDIFFLSSADCACRSFTAGVPRLRFVVAAATGVSEMAPRVGALSPPICFLSQRDLPSDAQPS